MASQQSYSSISRLRGSSGKTLAFLKEPGLFSWGCLSTFDLFLCLLSVLWIWMCYLECQHIIFVVWRRKYNHKQRNQDTTSAERLPVEYLPHKESKPHFIGITIAWAFYHLQWNASVTWVCPPGSIYRENPILSCSHICFLSRDISQGRTIGR